MNLRAKLMRFIFPTVGNDDVHQVDDNVSLSKEEVDKITINQEKGAPTRRKMTAEQQEAYTAWQEKEVEDFVYGQEDDEEERPDLSIDYMGGLHSDPFDPFSNFGL